VVRRRVSFGVAVICACGAHVLAARSGPIQRPTDAQSGTSRNQVAIPTRPAKPVFQGQQGEQWSSDISFDRQTRAITIKLSVQDVNGYFIPNLRRENFAVYEDGLLQKNATVEIEHAPVTLAVLLEGGGRYQQLNSFLRTELPFTTRPLLDVLGRYDKLAVFSYTNAVETLVDFNQPLANVDSAIDRLKPPGFSETNLYDALIDVLKRMNDVSGRKAGLLISTGIDTFSHATFEDVLHAAADAKTPVYCIGLGDVAKTLLGTEGPLAKIDWKRADEQLETLAKASGGRAYVRNATIEVPAIYDDIMEHLRVRYVITYISSNPGNGGSARTVRVALVNPKTGMPLRIVDAGNKVIPARVIVQGSYTP
jgi:VWFA-related protein